MPMPVRNHIRNRRHRTVPRYRWKRIKIFRSITMMFSSRELRNCTAASYNLLPAAISTSVLNITRRDFVIAAWRITLRGVFVVFISVFLAELGDKTQIATFLFATDPNRNRMAVFLASAMALTLSSLMAVFLGGQVARYVSPAMLKNLAGL